MRDEARLAGELKKQLRAWKIMCIIIYTISNPHTEFYMKKRIVVALVLVLVLSVALSVFTGCDEIFKKNDERDSKQVVATVTYGNQVAHVTKGEMVASFNNYAYYYTYYYGLSYQEAADYIVKSLAQRELLVLYAKEYIAKADNVSKAPELCTVKELLTVSEYSKAIDNTNEDMLSSLSTIIAGLITEDKANSGTETTKPEKAEVTDPVRVKFDSLGGSSVETQKIQRSTAADEPENPTYTGYSFYGWYTDKACTEGNKFYFESKVEETMTLYAKWVEFRTPRAVRADESEDTEENDPDYDPDYNGTDFVVSDVFFSEAYQAKIKSGEAELTDVTVKPTDAEFEEYLEEGIEKLNSNLKTLYHDYNYYLESEMKTLLVEKLERYIGRAVDSTTADVEAQWQRVIAENKDTFATSESAFATALTSTLNTTYFHKFTVDDNNSGYGFVVNLLLKLDTDATDELTTMVANGMAKSIITARRNQLLSAMQIHVTNPDYDADAEIDYDGDGETEDDEIVDPMTDPNNPFNGLSGAANATEYNADNNYDKIVEFKKNAESGEWEIVYNVKECPSMAYLLDTVPAFSADEAAHPGIVQQVYNSFESIKAQVTLGNLTHIESIYWLREMATTWVYLVGDDSGMTSTDNNNGGLGYLVTPEEEESSFIDAFTDHARGLIKAGTGSYTVDGTVGGSYVFADSFIESGATSNGYAGIFILLCSNKVWDDTTYTLTEDTEGNLIEGEQVVLDDASGILPLNYIISYGKTLDDCVTLYDQIKTSLDDGKKADLYNLNANSFGVKYANTIVYNEKVYKSLWKDLD